MWSKQRSITGTFLGSRSLDIGSPRRSLQLSNEAILRSIWEKGTLISPREMSPVGREGSMRTFTRRVLMRCSRSSVTGAPTLSTVRLTLFTAPGKSWSRIATASSSPLARIGQPRLHLLTRKTDDERTHHRPGESCPHALIHRGGDIRYRPGSGCGAGSP